MHIPEQGENTDTASAAGHAETAGHCALLAPSLHQLAFRPFGSSPDGKLIGARVGQKEGFSPSLRSSGRSWLNTKGVWGALSFHLLMYL